MIQQRALTPGEAAELRRSIERTIDAFAQRLELDRSACIDAVRVIVVPARVRGRVR